MWPFRKKPAPLAFPPRQPPVEPIALRAKPEPSIVVEEETEIDGEEIAKMNRSGMHRAWDRVTKKLK